jgi:sugar lactone lactonase YvrE
MSAWLRQAAKARAAALLALLCLAFPIEAASQQAICAAAKIELGQSATLEREGFTATLAMTNNLADQALSGLRIELVIKDAGGASAESLFFANVTSLEGTSAIDGTGTLQPSGAAKARWLLVPSQGAGGSGGAGLRYTVQARMSFLTGGVPRLTTTFPVAITVKPQPLLKLEYVLPFEVFGDEPLTQVVESTVPFPLGLRVTNVGAGKAKSFQLQSSQPLITDNAQGLAVDFRLLGTWLGSEALPENTLLIPFGDIPPGGAKQAAWSMVSTLSGRFVDFSSTFTHAAELGGALTSLIQSVTAYTLVKDVLVDLPGRDAQFDFLINATTPRSQLEADFALGREPKPEYLMESDRPGLTPVFDVPAQLLGELSGTGSVLHLAYLAPAASNTWVHASVAAPSGGGAPLVSVTRADGKVISPRNAWISRHFDKASRTYSSFLHILDYTGEAPADFAMAFNASAVNVPPAALADLSAAPAAAGALDLRWTAAGEDGTTGTIFGGRYAIFAATDPIVAPSIPAALVSFATSTPAGSAQSFHLEGLAGNATYFVTVYLADSSGQYSPASNRALALTPAFSPGGGVVSSLSAGGFALRWNTAPNQPGTQYKLTLSSTGIISESAYAADLSSAVFSGLEPDSAYTVTGSARNSALAETPAVLLASVITLALPPATTAPAFVDLSSGSVTARWLSGGNPAHTEFLVELSTSVERVPVFTSSGWIRAAEFIFTNLPPQAYFGRVKARNRNMVETSYADLGILRFDIAPPITEVVIGEPRFDLSGSIFIAGHTPLALSATDDLFVPGDGQGLGVRETLFAADNEPFQVFTESFTLPAEGLHDLRFHSVDLAGNVESTKTVRLGVDNTPPVTGIVFSSPSFTDSAGSLFIATFSAIGFTAQDPVSSNVASGVGSTEFRLDTATSSAAFQSFASSFTLAEGRHVIDLRSRDNVGNLELLKSATVAVDATPPASSLVIGAPQFQLPTTLLVSSRTPFSVAAVDAIVSEVASGVSLTQYRVSTGAFLTLTAPFTLASPEGPRTIEFFSQDNVLNVEVVKSSTVLLDATAPEAVLLSPSASGSGICSVVRGRFPVLGIAQDAHLRDYQLEVAVGSSSASGFTLISSGTAGVASGILGTWDARALSGWQTLQLTVTDLVENASQVSINVFVGDPGELLSLGNHEMFDLPEDVAVSSSGAIYVADRNNNRIAVFSSTGTLMASFGGREHDDDHGKPSTSTLRLNKPSGVAVDESGQVYVADTNNDRVLKLSAAGAVLLELGRQNKKKDDDTKPGKGTGEFNKPSGVAVDSTGSIYVSDRENRRVQVFSSTGAFTLQFPLPPVGQKADDDDDDKDKEEAGKPAGIAVDSLGNIYVADPKGGRVLKFSPAGTLLQSLTVVSEEGKRGQPFGVAVTPSGDCLLVSDRKHSLIFKFDLQGNQTLVFGGKGKKKKTGITFNKPMGLALDMESNLYVADRNNDKIRIFGLPGQSTLIVPAPKPGDDHTARAVVDTEEGGEVLRKDKAGVIVPAAALAEDIKITVSQPEGDKSEEKSRHNALTEKELKVVSPPVSYAPHGTQFEEPVTLVLPYNANLAEAQKADEASLQVHYWNESKKDWEALESQVDQKDKTVKAKTKHFSLYQVLAGSSTQTQSLKPLAADPSFLFRDLYVYPNPARAGAVPTLHLAVGIADKVILRIYDVSGQEVHKTTLFDQPSIINDGTGDKYAYEYAWVGRIASGIYLYVIEAEKQGFGTIRKTGKFGVVR